VKRAFPAILYLFLSVASGCDFRSAPAASAAPEVLYTRPRTGASNVPLDSQVEIYFTGHLDGRTVDPNTVRLMTGNLWYWGSVDYDPTRKRIHLTPRSLLRPGLLYAVYSEKGLKTLGGSDLTPQPLGYFTTGDWLLEDLDGGAPEPQAISFKKDILPLFQSRCASCHGRGGAGYGLDFSSKDGIVETVIGKKSDQWQDWYLVEPGMPGASYILYKISGASQVPGDVMPPPPGKQLDSEYSDIVFGWIVAGAAL